LIIVGSIVVNTNSSNFNCKEYLDTLKFFRWIYTDEKSKSIVESEGFYLPPQNQIDEIVQYLDSLTCDGEVVLLVIAVKSNKLPKIVITSFYWLVVVGSIITMATMNYNKPVAKVYAVILITGLLLCGLSMMMWTLTPVENIICTARYWLQGLGMVIFSGGVFCRSYQLKKIHQLVKSGRYQKSRRLDHFKLLITSMGIITLVEVIILLILEFSDPMLSELHITDEVNRIGEYHCENKIPFIWVAIQSGYLFCILLLGVYAMYSTWKISSSVDDTRINILMIFLCLVTLAVSDVIWSYNGADSPNKEDADSWWALSLICIWEICMMCSVFIPKLIKASKSSSSSNTNTNTSTSKPVTN